ncbi:OmpH family outer membrane protein [Paucibacter sp. APW11]|uniref:OmpH family outer membrane protein n=1 Tax=Roseateles aquae TaxID=3077235 RepID=A0ABU3P7E8_9BURK|nr:OmpH family outer membrane protein [Paucibacter sp. APW11]MDT8998494.1 OmpH family outer membrane protein [Paucibacter sp. APW11]
MKSKLLKTVAAAALLAASAITAHAQELKIGYVSTERILRETNLAKSAQIKLEAEFGKREKDLKELENKLRGAADKLQKDAPMLAEAERNRRERDLVEQDRDLQRKRREWQEDLQQRKSEEMQGLVDKANRVVKQIFETEKYDLIVQDALHASNRVDITKKVIDALNAQK